MTPKEKRERLFRHARPRLRAFEVFSGNEYHRDLKLLWAAHERKPVHGIGQVPQDEFAQLVTKIAQEFDLVVVEDDNKIKEIAVLRIADDGWLYEPHAIIYPWATKRNVLRSTVAFFQWARCSRKIGCIEVRCGFEEKRLYDHVCEYGVLHYVGKMVNGSPDGDTYIYSVKGKRDVNR